MGSLKLVTPIVEDSGKERTLQKSYWADHALEASVEAMMLDSQAKMIDREERPEVCQIFIDEHQNTLEAIRGLLHSCL